MPTRTLIATRSLLAEVARIALLGVCLAVGVAGAASAAVKVRVVAGHLNSPKHLLVTDRGVYVAESGTGGPVGAKNCIAGPSTEVPGPTRFCTGRTGAVVLIRGDHVTVAASKLASSMEENPPEAAGPSAVTVDPKGRLSILFDDAQPTSTGATALPAPAASVFGTFQMAGGRVAQIARFDATHPQSQATLGGVPNEIPYDSDPFDVVAYKTGYVVADAGSNSIVFVSKAGQVSLIARFPTFPETVPAGVFGTSPVPLDAQAVPTSVAVGSDGALYVGILRGVPSLPGTADIFRVVPGHAPTIWASGLTTVTGLAFDPHHRLLATEYSSGGLLGPATAPGAIVRISANGKHITQLPVARLFQPTGIAVGADGTIYVSNNGDSAANAAKPGEVLKITGA
jgi:hypothetical protein